MQRITPDRPWPLFDVAATRAIEEAAAANLPTHTLMERAGLAVARLALAVAPHARSVWIASGPGNNGGDGIEAAMHLQAWGKAVAVTWLGDETRAPADTLASVARARQAGVTFVSEAPAHWDIALDALLGLGNTRPMQGRMAAWAGTMSARRAPVLAIDLPSGLNADTGAGDAVQATHTLSLLTLKPGLFTAGGRDAAGDVWFDDLGVAASQGEPASMLAGRPVARKRRHASHKGSYGDVAIIGGAPGMAGAVLLAASAALHSGAGRVFAALLDPSAATVDPVRPDLMRRAWESLDLASMAVACGPGGGDAVRAVLPKIISTARALVLDADALNAIAADPQLQTLLVARTRRDRPTVLTPHPLEAARLLGCSTSQVQEDRLAAARTLVQRYAGVVVLKGSGTVIAARNAVPLINATGNARLAIGGTGDVLAGMIAARLAAGATPLEAAASAVYTHGMLADTWPAGVALSANALAHKLSGT